MNACGPAAAANARLVTIIGTAVLPAVLLFSPPADAASPGAGRLVVVLYPTDNDGSPGNREADHGIRSTFASGAGESVEVENEYLDHYCPVRSRIVTTGYGQAQSLSRLFQAKAPEKAGFSRTA